MFGCSCMYGMQHSTIAPPALPLTSGIKPRSVPQTLLVWRSRGSSVPLLHIVDTKLRIDYMEIPIIQWIAPHANKDEESFVSATSRPPVTYCSSIASLTALEEAAVPRQIIVLASEGSCHPYCGLTERKITNVGCVPYGR